MGGSIESFSAMAMEGRKVAKASVPRASRRRTPEQWRRYYEKHKESIKEYQRNYRAANGAKLAKAGKEKASVPRAGRRSAPEQRRRYRERNNEYQRKFRVANKDKIAASREQNKESIKEYQRNYRTVNRERRKEYQRKYRAANKDKRKEYDKRRWVTPQGRDKRKEGPSR